MKRIVLILLLSLGSGAACSLHKASQPADPDAPATQSALRKRLFNPPLAPQDGQDHFFEQNWRNSG
jgi:hypothetical protein